MIVSSTNLWKAKVQAICMTPGAFLVSLPAGRRGYAYQDGGRSVFLSSLQVVSSLARESRAALRSGVAGPLTLRYGGWTESSGGQRAPCYEFEFPVGLVW